MPVVDGSFEFDYRAPRDWGGWQDKGVPRRSKEASRAPHRRISSYGLSDRLVVNRQARCQQALDEWLGRLGRGGEPHDGDDCDKVLSSDDAVALAKLRARLEKAGRARRDRLPAVRRMHARLSAMHASTVDIVV
jgi:hypothetical protein